MLAERYVHWGPVINRACRRSCSNQIASPACTELEMKVLDWLAEMLGLPDCFKFSKSTFGGGVIQGTASEATLVALLAARSRVLGSSRCRTAVDANNNNLASVELSQPEVSFEKLVGYCSDLAHSSVERAGLLGGVLIKTVASDEQCRLRGDALKSQIIEDKRNGLVPFIVVATLGTTSVCSYDDIEEIGQVCEQFGLWLHVDAAYAGNSFVCPENRHLMKGIEVSNWHELAKSAQPNQLASLAIYWAFPNISLTAYIGFFNFNFVASSMRILSMSIPTNGCKSTSTARLSISKTADC